MKTRLLYLWDTLRSSFWFVPTCIITVGIIGSILVIYLDSKIAYTPEGFIRYIFPGSASSARSVLSTIASAMIGVAGTIFSITLVVLTLASSQFGSRLLRNFMYDRLNQVVLGSYISTFIYCLLILNSVENSEKLIFLPIISVLIAIFLVVVNMFLLIMFIHHVAVSIQSDKIVYNIASTLKTHIKERFQEKNVEDSKNATSVSLDIEAYKSSYNYKSCVTSRKNGYLQSIDMNSLLSYAKEYNLFLKIHYKPGDFFVEHLNIVDVYSSEACSESIRKRIFESFITGDIRTPLQDSKYAVHQMVEIASRALSPGVNDPYTAIACIDNLSAILCYLANANFPSKYLFDDTKTLRIITSPLSFKEIIDTAFNQIRQFAGGSPAVLIRLMDALLLINTFTKDTDNNTFVIRHTEMVMRLAEIDFKEKNDIEDMKTRFSTLIR